MIDTSQLLGALQLSDSALPIGRFVHSQGVEAWLHAHPSAGSAEITKLARTMVEATARVDSVFLAHAHIAGHINALTELDERLTARKTSPSARTLSTACGRQLAALGTRLVDDPLVSDFADLIAAGRTDGNLAIITGTLTHALHVNAAVAVAVELRGTAAAVMSVAVRLGRLTPTHAQIQLTALHPSIAAACDTALITGLDDAFTSTPELEIAALAHHRRPIRFFTT